LRQDRYLALDGLRGIAALAVMVMHKGRWFLDSGGFLAHAYLAVDFFFMLSGFVIAAAYDRRLSEGMTASRFIFLRWARLYPLILAGLLLGAACRLLVAAVDIPGPPLWALPGSLIRGLLLVPSLHLAPGEWGIYPLNGPTWSLFFELAANLAFVLVFRWLGPRALVAVVAAGVLLVVGLAFSGGIDAGATPREFLGGFPRVTYGFFAGVLLNRLLRGRSDAPIAWALPVTAVALLAVFVVPGGRSWNPAFELACLLLLFPAMIVLAARAPVLGWRAPLCAVAGALSYPVYVLHIPVYGLITVLVLKFGWSADHLRPWLGLGAATIILTVSWLALKLYDEPVRAWLVRFAPGARLASAPGQ